MENLSTNDRDRYDAPEIIRLDKSDVESAVMQFICKCHPEYAKDHIIDVDMHSSCVALVRKRKD